MYPVLIQWGSLVIPSWHVLYVLGAIAGWFIFDRLLRAHDRELGDDHSAWIFAVCYIFGYFGARALSILIEEPEHHSPGAFLSALLEFGAMTLYGGVLGGFGAGWLYLIARRVPFGPVFDSAIPAVMVGVGFGRLGCFLNGDDYGRAVGFAPGQDFPWWAVTFPNLADQTPRYPVQLWEAGFGFALAFVLLAFRSKILRVLRSGSVGVLGVFAYAVFRFWNERYRGDVRGWLLENRLSTSQAISTVIILLIIGLIPLWLRKPQS